MNNLYQRQLLDLAREIREIPALSGEIHTVSLKNPLCGDRVTLNVSLKNGVVAQRHIAVEGCALCAAGAGYWYKCAAGRSIDELRSLKDELSAYLDGKIDHITDAIEPFKAVKPLKNRHKCVLLALDASTALADKLDRVL